MARRLRAEACLGLRRVLEIPERIELARIVVGGSIHGALCCARRQQQDRDGVSKRAHAGILARAIGVPCCRVQERARVGFENPVPLREAAAGAQACCAPDVERALSCASQTLSKTSITAAMHRLPVAFGLRDCAPLRNSIIRLPRP
jgi:hypothetical protein